MIKIKIFSIITIILLLSLPIVLSEEQIILNNLTQDALQEKTKNMDFKKLSIILPINAQLHITNLDSYVYLQVTEDGVFLPKELDKVNIEISAHQDYQFRFSSFQNQELYLSKYSPKFSPSKSLEQKYTSPLHPNNQEFQAEQTKIIQKAF